MNKEERNSFRKEMLGKLEEQWAKSNSPEDQAYDLLDDIDFYYNKGEVPQDRKALTGIEQTGDTRTKVPIACVGENNFFFKNIWRYHRKSISLHTKYN